VLPRGQQTTDHFFNVSAFAPQVFGTFGNVGRNTSSGHGFFIVDASLIKNFKIHRDEDAAISLGDIQHDQPSELVQSERQLLLREKCGWYVFSEWLRVPIGGTRTSMRQMQFV